MTKITYNTPTTLAEKLQYVSLKCALKFIAGTNHYHFEKPKEGDRVILVPEPLNKKDPKAIAIYNMKLQKMGHLTKQKKVNEYVFDILYGKTPAYGIIRTIENKETTPLYLLDLTNISERL